jgi:hypothetical protein
MELSFSKINGTNPYLDYEIFKNSIIEELQYDCEKVEVLILNQFPIAVASQSTLDFLIFLKVPTISKKRPKIFLEDNFVYISNLIIAVSVISGFSDDKIRLEDNELIATDQYITANEQASKLKWGLTNYLQHACNLSESITVHPIFWVRNNEKILVLENTVVAKSLTFKLIKKCISLNNYLKFPGYVDWNYEYSYENSIGELFKQASLDSEWGYLTKQKIERLQSRFEPASQKGFDEIGNKLVLVSGKAGTGKSSDLLKWMLKNSLDGKAAVFLTYNNLLVFEISKQILSFRSTFSKYETAGTASDTIHAFIYNISKKLGVILLMSEIRVNELKNILSIRLEKVKILCKEFVETKKDCTRNDLKKHFQNLNSLDQGTKREALDFLNHNLIFTDFNDYSKLLIEIELFQKIKIKIIEANVNSKVFLSDYHEVLKNTLKAIQNKDLFFKDFQIEDKFELLENQMNLSPSIMEDDGSGKINLERLKTRYNRSISAFRSGRTLFVDEAQDCHPYERDIFFALFNSKNIVIASGGKEQLIRYSEVCDWNVSQNIKTVSYQYNKKRKSFRMKPAIAALVNHISASFEIELNIEPLDTPDHGLVIIDKNESFNLQDKANLINELLEKGTRQGCSAYDAILLMKNAQEVTHKLKSPHAENFNDVVSSPILPAFKINEFDVIKIDSRKNKSSWELVDVASKTIKDARIWNATGNVDKKKQSVPGSLSIRAIYYESSRGLEAWSTMCFDINGFFDSKRREDGADNFLLNEIMDPELRKDKYAATWVLMALTRAIDTCYLEIKPSDNALMKSIGSFAKNHPDYIQYVE